MDGEILMGFDESTLAYDLQRAHSADIWFLRARFWLWGGIFCVSSFLLGNLIARFGIDIFGSAWAGFWNLVYS